MAVMPRRNTPRTAARRAEEDPRPSGLGSHRRRDGTTKAAYMSRGEALSVAEEQSLESGLELQVYRCAECSAWHLGTPVERGE
jgi:hypothetical protein